MTAFATDGEIEDRIDDLPPSAKLVYKVLEYNGQMTQKEVSEETRLSVRTVRYALNRLGERDLIKQVPCLTDGRRTLYDVEDHGEAEAEAAESVLGESD
ncbi:MAG: MarR family transcriptional regulator [Halobacteriota archaeon]